MLSSLNISKCKVSTGIDRENFMGGMMDKSGRIPQVMKEMFKEEENKAIPSSTT
ncbi:hypothetical protein KACHI17_06590 [Sediminibacterium sp. KACHI17]|jgi:hypothetical protein|uniref:Uncharacterized protein n=1 Tax=Sediminibacterium sp. KACHI17 TaxID=1751071 RepID=A0AAT9GGS5_9BACT